MNHVEMSSEKKSSKIEQAIVYFKNLFLRVDMFYLSARENLSHLDFFFLGVFTTVAIILGLLTATYLHHNEMDTILRYAPAIVIFSALTILFLIYLRTKIRFRDEPYFRKYFRSNIFGMLLSWYVNSFLAAFVIFFFI